MIRWYRIPYSFCDLSLYLTSVFYRCHSCKMFHGIEQLAQAVTTSTMTNPNIPEYLLFADHSSQQSTYFPDFMMATEFTDKIGPVPLVRMYPDIVFDHSSRLLLAQLASCVGWVRNYGGNYLSVHPTPLHSTPLLAYASKSDRFFHVSMLRALTLVHCSWNVNT